jgi:hypothetical protein
MMAIRSILDRALDPVGKALGPEAAQRLVQLRADASVQQRVEELADRANEGALTADERSEYADLVSAATVVGLLQAKARAILVDRGGN